MSRAARLLLLLVRLYQRTLSPLLGRHCRYEPTCSHYAADAVRVHGARRGAWLALKRIARCHPWSAGGIDRVPAAVGGRATQEAPTR